MKRLVGISVLVLFFLLLLFYFANSIIKTVERFNSLGKSDRTDMIIKKDRLIAYNLKNHTNETIILKGLTVINFWRYDCKPCIEELQLFLEPSKKYKFIFLTSDSSYNTLNTIDKYKTLSNSFFYSDTTLFGETSIIPRTIVLFDKQIKVDNSGIILKDQQQINVLLDSLNRIYL